MSISNQPAGKKEQVAQRRAQVLALRITGLSHRKIAEQVGCEASAVTRDLAHCMRRLAEQQSQLAGELRAMELERLDLATAAIADKVKAGDYRATDLWIRLSESRRRLLGLDVQPAYGAGGDALAMAGITINVVPPPGAPKRIESSVVESPEIRRDAAALTPLKAGTDGESKSGGGSMEPASETV